MLSWQIILYTLSAGFFYSLLATGFGLILRSVKFFVVSYGGAILVGGYMMFWFYRILGIYFLLSVILSVIASGVYMFISYRLIFSPLIRRKAANFTLLIASFGLLTATSATIGMLFGSQATFIARRFADVFTMDVLGGSLNIVQVVNIIVTPIVICILALVLRKTRFGRATRAVEDDSEVAELVGISKDKVFARLFFVSGMLAGLGGIAEGLDLGIIPSSGLFYMLPVIVVSVLGGMKSFWGGILGAFVLAILQKLTVVFLGGSWEAAVPFVVLMIILLIRPEGILKR